MIIILHLLFPYYNYIKCISKFLSFSTGYYNYKGIILYLFYDNTNILLFFVNSNHVNLVTVENNDGINRATNTTSYQEESVDNSLYNFKSELDSFNLYIFSDRIQHQ